MNPDRSAILNRLLRSISLSAGEFALLLARCNSSSVRDEVVDELRSHLGTGLYLWQATPEVGAINLVEILEDAPEGTQVACVTGLETSPHLHDILAIANNAREEFRSRFQFPLVLWVTDEVEAQLRRRSPDLASWAAPPFGFALDQTELQAILNRQTQGVVEKVFSKGNKQRSTRQDLQGIWQEWQSHGAILLPEIEARVALLLSFDAGSDEAARNYLEQCLSLSKSGSLLVAAHYRLGLWWKQYGKRNRAEFLVCFDRAREQLQKAWSSISGKNPDVALELAEVLLELALPEAQESLRWVAVADFSKELSTLSTLAYGLQAEVALVQKELSTLSTLAYGLQAEVALVQKDYQAAKQDAEKALQTKDQERSGWFFLSLGRSLLGLDQAQAAIDPLEQARAATPPDTDPDLHIRILRSVHQAYTVAGLYRRAFSVKCDRLAVEAQYGFRAFIGAGRLRPQRHIGELGAGTTEEIAASGRQSDIDALVERVKRNDCRLTVIHGPSGVGKSSLLQAGLVPVLRKLIHQSRSVVPVVVEQYEDWQRELRIQLGWAQGAFPELSRESEISTDLLIEQLGENDRRQKITVLIFDQFEEFFFQHPDVPGRRQWYDFLRACLEVPFVWVVLSLREDYVHYLLECDRLANLTLINNDILNKNIRYYLGNFDPERAKAVIRELTERSPYRLEPALCDRLVADLAAELGEVRPIELQVVGAQMLQNEVPITALAAYTALGEQPKQALVERWLNQVVQDCGEENEELAKRVLVALTEEPEKRPVKTKTELQRELQQGKAEESQDKDLGVPGDLDFVLTVLVRSGLAFELLVIPEAGYQLIHDYLVFLIRRPFGMNWVHQLALERQQRKVAEKELAQALQEKLAEASTSNRRLRQVLMVAVVFAVGAFIAGGVAAWQKKVADQNALNSREVADSSIWKGLMDAKVFDLEEQVSILEKAKDWQGTLTDLRGDNRLELLATLHRAAHMPRPREEKTFEGHQGNVSSVAFAPGSQTVLTGSGDNTAKLWNRDGRLLQTFRGHQAAVISVAFAPGSQTVLTGSGDNTAKLWNRDGPLLQTFRGHQAGISSVAFSPDEKTVLTGSRDKTAKLWSLNSRLLQTFQGHLDAVSSVAFAPDGQTVLTGSSDETAKLWSLDGRLLQTFQGHLDAVSSVAFAPDGQTVLTGSWDKTARLWSLDGRLLQTFQEQTDIWSVTFAPDGQTVLTGSWDGTAKLWSRSGRLLHTFQGHQSAIWSVAFAPDGQTVLTGSWDKTAKLWSLDVRLRTFQRPTFTDSEDRGVVLFPDGQMELKFPSKANKPADKSNLSRELNRSRGNTVQLQRRDGRLLHTFRGHQGAVNDAVFAPDGQTVLTGSEDKTAKLWSLEGRLLQTFQGHQDTVNGVAFAPDGQTVLTGSGDKTARLWSLDGRLLHTFQEQTAIWSVGFAPDGQAIWTASRDGTAKLWNLDINESLALMCDHLRDFAAGRSDLNPPEGSYQLRERARRACEGIPPPKPIQASDATPSQPPKLSWWQNIIGASFQAVFHKP